MHSESLSLSDQMMVNFIAPLLQLNVHHFACLLGDGWFTKCSKQNLLSYNDIQLACCDKATGCT